MYMSRFLPHPAKHGGNVFSINRALHNLGYLRSKVDDIFHAGTDQALRQWQENAGINPDGVVDPDVWCPGQPGMMTLEHTVLASVIRPSPSTCRPPAVFLPQPRGIAHLPGSYRQKKHPQPSRQLDHCAEGREPERAFRRPLDVPECSLGRIRHSWHQ